MLKHFLELNASIILLPMQKMLIIEILVCNWLNMSDVLSWSLLLAFGRWLAFMFFPFAPFLVLRFPWLSLSTSCHGFSLCFLNRCTSCFEHFDLLTMTFFDSCPSTERLYSLIDHHNSFTQRGTSCRLDFNLRPLDPHFNLSWLKLCEQNICPAVRLIANCVRGSSPVMNVLSTANRSVGVKFCYENRVGLVARDWHRKHR